MSDSRLFHIAFSVLKTEVRAMGRIVCWWAACLMEHRQAFIHTLLRSLYMRHFRESTSDL